MLSAFPIKQLFRRKKSGVTAHLIARASSFEEYGLFDSKLFSGADNMWCRQAYANGAKAELVDGLAVRHPARGSFQELRTKGRRVAGGRAHRSRLHENESRNLLTILRGYFPPVKYLKKVWGHPTAKVWLKFKVTLLSIYLRWDKTSYELCCRLGLLRKLERQ